MLFGGINKQSRDQWSMYAALTRQPNVDCKWTERANGCVTKCMYDTVCLTHKLLCGYFLRGILSLYCLGFKGCIIVK